MTDNDQQPKDEVLYVRCPAAHHRKIEVIKQASIIDGRSVTNFMLHYGYLSATLVLKRNRKVINRPKEMAPKKMAKALVKQIIDRSFADVRKNRKKRKITKIQKFMLDNQQENQ